MNTPDLTVMTLHFVVHGVPQPKGSAKAFIPKGWRRAIVTSDNTKNKGWQQLVAEAASLAIDDRLASECQFRLIETSALLRVAFYLPRPKAIKDKLVPHTKKPDLDKLVRSVKDALSKVAWRDDSLVVEIAASKAYARPGEPPRAEISVSECESKRTV
jgi:Holliday junction resolvase RusA-like endonuclease